MSSLVVGGVVIPVAFSSPSGDLFESVDRASAFDNTYRVSQTGGTRRAWTLTTKPVPKATSDTYRSQLAVVTAQLCSGDVISTPTMCCAQLTGFTPMSVQGAPYEVLNFTLHEVQPASVLLRYAPGTTITGESFTRSTVAYQVDASGIYVSKAINTKRDGHYTGWGGASTVRTLLLEDTRTNVCLRSNDLANATWTTTGTMTAVMTAVGLDGAANTATTVGDTDAGVSSFKHQSITVPVDSNKHSISFYILKDAVVSRFPLCYVTLTGGTSVSRAVSLNTQTGASNGNVATAGTTTFRVVDGGLWWIVEITVTNNGSASNTNLGINLYPAYGGVIGGANVATTGTVVAGQVQVELNSPFYSSPIFTTTASVARGADFYSLPFTELPKEMSVFTKYTDLGTAATPGSFVFDISNAANTGARFLSHINGGLTAYHHNGGAPVESAGLAAATYGNVVELLTRLYGDGSVDATQSLNSAAATSSAITGAQSLPAAWSGQLVWINSPGTVAAFNGFGAYQSFKIVGGARTLTEMRGA